MGVLEFFGTLIRSDITASSIKSNYTERSAVNHLLLDFNSIIHVSSQRIVTEINVFLQLVLKNLYQHHSLHNPIMTELFTKYDMQEIQKRISKQTPVKMVIEMFHSHFNEKYLDKQIITLVINTVLGIIRTYCSNRDIQTLMIAIDGVPSKGKLVEQKQRRYISAIVESYKGKLLEKYKDYLLEQPDNVYVASKHSIKWNRNKITPGTTFMHKLAAYLHSEKIQSSFKANRPQMKVLVSSMYETGEGEKKIVNYIKAHLAGTSDKVMVYSPDADMILLCMLLPVEDVYFLRHNQQTSGRAGVEIYDLIDIALLKNNIGYYINNHPDYSKEEFLINRINQDIVCLSTLFGNDFVPKIETINVKQGFQDIMDAYLDTLVRFKSKKYYLVNIIDDEYRLNFTFLKYVISKLLPHEKEFIDHNGLYTRYINAGYIKHVFDYLDITEENIHRIVSQFRSDYEMFKTLIRNGGSTIAYESNDRFMSSLKKSIDLKVDGQTVNTSFLTDEQLVRQIVKYYRSERNFPRLNLNIQEYSHSINDTKHRRILKGKNMNAYEKEKYQFEYMLDGYYIKLNAQPLQLDADKIDQYYKSYFGITVYSQKTNRSEKNGNLQLSSKALDVMFHYIEGLLWVFSYYFNDLTYLNTWYYRYERAPLLHQISQYLDSVDASVLTRIYDGLSVYRVNDIRHFFTPLEQLMYVSPMTPEIISLLPKNYQEYIRSDELDPFLQKYFINIKKLTEKLWSDVVSNDMDCHSIPFLSKCLIKPVNKQSTQNDQKFIRAMRQVPATAESIKLSKSTSPPY